ncbi:MULTISPECIES: NAD(P)/FAD-dependent oxidoreductase [unclassified Mycobacteroides]|uniref:flavin-containing monooxygenase n=1 Tax=unclassified Mycobacteroides TaxID=2618759 RepID=UPI001325DF20|nr:MULTISPECIES: NAD(P)/FAD-dependent oxidoreductase [unclassified Mycobacteroides]MUM18111.1 cyclohexanone monooxygenase [Mycobacteroides sp. CBMA 326]
MKNFDVVVVGAGFAGLYALYRLRSQGLSAIVFEAGSDVGGTWFFNRYPGARCDVESIDYSYSFSDELQQDWDWTEKYATQEEILRYINHVADRFDLRRDIHCNTRVASAVLDEDSALWTVRTEQGDEVTARFCVMATGALSTANMPNIPGLDAFAGELYHTGHWPSTGVDFTGKRVGVIGTGSSGIQLVPIAAQTAKELYVFQRTANYSVPAGNTDITPERRAEAKANYDERRRQSRESGGGSPHQVYPQKTLDISAEERRAAFENRWNLGGVLFGKTFPDQTTDMRANDEARLFFEEKVRTVIDDPAVADVLIPQDHPIGTKRICTDTNYFQTYNRDNVHVVDLRAAPIESIDSHGITTTEHHYGLDMLIFATGFDAMTGSLNRIDIQGRAGQPLKDAWHAGPRTYLGLGVDGFPNLFIVTGPGSPSVLANMVLGAEQHVDWIGDLLNHMTEHGFSTVEAEPQAVTDWVSECNQRAASTMFPQANSWYLGANIPGKPRVFMPFIGGFGVYGAICSEVAASGYKGFTLTGSNA